MAIDKNSNSFTFTFAIIMVAVVGSLLAFTYMQLKPFQAENVRREKMQNILAAMNVKVSRDDAPARYEELIKETRMVDAQGKEVEGDAFELDVRKQYKDEKARVITADQMLYPLYVAEQDGQPLYILPMVGTGLWGPIWGYVAVAADGRTVVGSTFDHQGETPGLGAEISTPIFTKQFPGKTFVDEQGGFTSIKVYKGGSETSDPHGVDGISGGTITSDGVGEMLSRSLKVYHAYLSSIVSAPKVEVVEVEEVIVEQEQTEVL